MIAHAVLIDVSQAVRNLKRDMTHYLRNYCDTLEWRPLIEMTLEELLADNDWPLKYPDHDVGIVLNELGIPTEVARRAKAKFVSAITSNIELALGPLRWTNCYRAKFRVSDEDNLCFELQITDYGSRSLILMARELQKYKLARLEHGDSIDTRFDFLEDLDNWE